MLTSMTWAPFSTCWRATPSASSNWPLRIRRANAFEPVTLVRSPMLTKSDPSPSSHRLEAGELEGRRRPPRGHRRPASPNAALGPTRGAIAADALGDQRDVLGRRAAAAAGDVEEARPGELLEQASGDLGRLVEAGLAHRIGQAGVRIAAHEGVAGDPRELLDVRPHQRRAERAVEADRERPRVAHAVPERADGLAREDPPRGVGDGARDDHRQALAAVFHQLVEGEDRRLGVERVEDRLDQEQVAAAFEQALGLFAIGVAQLGEGDVAGGRIVDVGADARRPRRRPERAGDEAGLVDAGELGARLARQARAGDVHLARDAPRS